MQEPLFKETGDFFEVTFWRPIASTDNVDNLSDASQTEQKSSGKSSGKTENHILSLLGENPHMTLPELADTLNLSSRAIDKQVKKLKETGQLERIGARKSGYWQVNAQA